MESNGLISGTLKKMINIEITLRLKRMEHKYLLVLFIITESFHHEEKKSDYRQSLFQKLFIVRILTTNEHTMKISAKRYRFNSKW